jgi:hypothetical protein
MLGAEQHHGRLLYLNRLQNEVYNPDVAANDL